MATTTATITLSSTDLLSDELALSTTATLTTAGTATGVTQASGLSRKTTSAAAAAAIQANVLYRAGDYLANGANKVYIKNTSTTVAEFYTVVIDQEVIGRLYAGDWMFMPWSATSGTFAEFRLTIAGSWVAGDTWEFDGVTATAPTGLYAGQAGLFSGQQQIGKNITGELGGIGGDLASFRTAAEAYQRQAETARGDIQGTQRSGQSAMEQQIGSVGLASNRAAEMLTQQRQAESLAAKQRASAQPDPVSQQAQSFAQTAGRNLSNPTQQQVGPLGPQSQDPRDVFIQNLFRTSQGLMNRTPV